MQTDSCRLPRITQINILWAKIIFPIFVDFITGKKIRSETENNCTKPRTVKCTKRLLFFNFFEVIVLSIEAFNASWYRVHATHLFQKSFDSTSSQFGHYVVVRLKWRNFNSLTTKWGFPTFLIAYHKANEQKTFADHRAHLKD